jgi:hypothetical protein
MKHKSEEMLISGALRGAKCQSAFRNIERSITRLRRGISTIAGGSAFAPIHKR